MVALVTLVAVLVLDEASGLFYRTSTTASVQVTAPRSGNTTELLVVFGGYASDCGSISAAFGPALDSSTALAVFCYAERGVDDDQAARLIIDQVRDLKPLRLRVLGGSLGGLVATRFVTRYAKSAEAKTTGLPVLVLDTVPSGRATVRRPGWLFSVADWYRGGVISSQAWRLLAGLGARPTPEAGAEAEPIAQGERANANIGMPALTSQASYLASFDPAEMSDVGEATSRVIYLEGSPPRDDPLINVPAAVADWSAAIPALVVHQLPERDGSWHVPWTYRPRETLAAVIAG